MEGLGVAFVDSIMTLIAFLPVLAALSVHVDPANIGAIIIRWLFIHCLVSFWNIASHPSWHKVTWIRIQK